MKNRKKGKSRAELHVEFVRECQQNLDRFRPPGSTKHQPIDAEINKLRNGEIAYRDLVKIGQNCYRVIDKAGRYLTLSDVNTHEVINFLEDERVIKL